MFIRISLFTKYCYLFFLLSACTNNKNINSSLNAGAKKLHFLPVQISYTGIALEDSLKDFITGYFKTKNIEIIDKEYVSTLIKNEVQRAAGVEKTADPEEFQKKLNQNLQYVFNLVTINFKLDTTGRKIEMGWRVVPEPVNFSRLIQGRWKYLTNHKISDAPPQDELRALCDSILYSKTLY